MVRATHIAVIDGSPFKMRNSRICDELIVSSKKRVWHLWEGSARDEYVGHFNTKAEAKAHAKMLAARTPTTPDRENRDV